MEQRKKYIEDFYNFRCSKDINSPDVVGWIDKQSQNERFDIFLEYIKPGDKILDYGCGVGDFFNYATDKLDIDYKGVDIQKTMIDRAKKKYPEGDFKLINSIADIHENFDWIIASGVFTVGMNEYDVLNYFHIGKEKASKGIGSNFIKSKYSYKISSGKKYINYNKKLLKNFLEEHLHENLTLIDKIYDDFTLILKW